jgi:adenylylsulfate kinase
MPPAPSSADGHVFWLFGLSGAGKTTLARGLAEGLRREGRAVLELDGDVLRAGLCAGLGFSDAERAENLRRAAEAAKLGLASGLTVVAAFITPLRSHRELIARIVPAAQLSWVFVDAPLELCRQRDVKQLYAAAANGRVAQLTGVSAPFEAPAACDLRLETGSAAVDLSVQRLLDFARARLKSRPAL